jgi:type VI secretion system secreted protein Hcp
MELGGVKHRIHGRWWGGGAGKVAMQDFHFSMPTNTASPKLLRACASGEHIKMATLYCRKAGKEQQEYMNYKFSDILISSYQTGGSHSAEIPVESISFNFSKIEFEYREQKPDGSLAGAIKAGWDLKANKMV